MAIRDAREIAEALAREREKTAEEAAYREESPEPDDSTAEDRQR